MIMLILAIRTDKEEAELELYENTDQLQSICWSAHRELAETIHFKIKNLLEKQAHNIHDVSGIMVYEGPGSFTGLRIGISVANALADGLSVPIVGVGGEDWIKKGLKRITKKENDHIVKPKYGAPPHITQAKK
jgi:tRNA threonylcarbamoyladenosine biosynthesis protein TsaB